MRLLSDDRAQALQVGAILLFAIIIILFALWQAFIIPNQNETIEFNHNQDAQEQMSDLRSTAVSMPGVITPRSATVNLGVRYPSRTVFRNPTAPSGWLRTVGTTDDDHAIIIENATAVEEGDDIGVDDFWRGEEQSYDTGAIEYRPNYNYYKQAPVTVYEHSVLYNRFEEGETLTLTDQTVVDDDRITLIALDGSFEQSRVDATSVSLRPVSTRTRTVDIRDAPDGGALTIHLPTTLAVDEWRAMLGDEDTVEVSPSARFADGVELTFDSGRYQLRMAKLGIGTDVTETEAAYLNGVDGNGAEIRDDRNHSFTVAVRDEYNNPKEDATVRAFAENGEIAASKETDSDGEATFEYDPGSVTGQFRSQRVNFSISYAADAADHDVDAPENITMSVSVSATDESEEEAFQTDWAVVENPPALTYEDGVWRYNHTEAQGADLELPITTTPPADETVADFAVSDTEIATVDGQNQITDGASSTTLTPLSEGTLTVHTWAGGSGDRIELEIVDIFDPGDPLPEGDVAFHDDNENERYDEGETTYSVGDLEDLDLEGHLVVQRDVVVDDSGPWQSGSDIEAERILLEPGVEFRTEGGGKPITMSSEGEIRIDGAMVGTTGGGSGIELAAAGPLNAGNAEVTTTGGGSPISLTAADDMNIGGLDASAGSEITISSDGAVNGENAELTTTDGGAPVSITSVDDMNIAGLTANAGAEIAIDSDGEVNAGNAGLTTTGDAAITMSSDDDMNIGGLTANAGASIDISSDGAVNGENADLTASGNGDTITVTSSDDMTVPGLSGTAGAGITLDADGAVEGDETALAVTGEGDIGITSTDHISLRNGAAEAVNVMLDASGFIDLDGASLTSTQESDGELTGDLTGNADLFVEDAEFRDVSDPAAFVYAPSSVNVIGTPGVGTATN